MHSRRSSVRFVSPDRTEEDRARHLSRSMRARRPGEITCKDCGKPSDEKDKVWMGRRCAECTRKWHRENLRTNADTQRSSLGAMLRFHHDVSLAQWDSMLAKQKGACAICGHVPDGSRGKRDKRLQVDHCHRTGAIRSILCLQCNLLIGHAQECPDRLIKAAEYVAAFNGTNWPPSTLGGRRPESQPETNTNARNAQAIELEK